MAELPININPLPAKPATSTAKNSTPQNGEGFGNVLARQMDNNTRTETSRAETTNRDTSRPAEGDQTSKQSVRQKSEQNETADSGHEESTADNTSTMTPEMVAALLAQPIKTEIQQAGTPGSDETGTLDAQGSNGNPANSKLKPGLLVAAQKQGKGAITDDGAQVQSKGLFNAQLDLTHSASTDKKPAVIPLADFKPAAAELSNRDLSLSALQPAMMHALNPAATDLPTGKVSINTPFAQPGWGEEFSQKVSWIATQQNQTAELHLNPPQLGPLDVVLKLTGDQATAMFSSPHASVRDAIEQAMPKLREILADSGIMLGNATVSDQSAQKNQDEFKAKNNRGDNKIDALADEPLMHETSVRPARQQHGLVDTFV